MVSSTSFGRFSGADSRSIFADSSFEKSSTSLTRCTNDCPLLRMIWSISRCSSDRSVSSSRLVVPMMPFIGVRISWLMLARKFDFASFASSAWAWAMRSWRIPSLTLSAVVCRLSAMRLKLRRAERNSDVPDSARRNP